MIAGKRALAQLLCASGEPEAGWSSLWEARQLAAQINAPQLLLACAALEADLKLRQGQLAAAERCAANMEQLAGGQPTTGDSPCLTRARICIAQGRLDQARALLERMERSAVEQAHYGRLISIYVLHSLAQRAAGYETAAQRRLAEAARLAAAEDYDRYFLDEGQEIAALLPAIRGGAPVFVNRLIEEFALESFWLISRREGAPARYAEHHATALASQAESLSERELDVLQLIARGLTYPEIAARLTISLNTVRFHIKSVYGKLNVHRRHQAIARGRDLHLLDQES